MEPVPLVIEKVMFPPSPSKPPRDRTSPADMLPPAVERAIFPAGPKAPEASKYPAMSIAPVPSTLRVISPPPPARRGLEIRFPVVILPPAVERVIAPPTASLEINCRTPAVVSIAPGPPVTVRVIFPGLTSKSRRFLETSDLVVMLPPAVEREIDPEFPDVIAEEEISAATVLISLVLVRVIFPPVVTRLAFD